MRPVVKDFVLDVAEQLPLLDPIVEIGARPAAGQESETDLRGLFAGHDYIGCDMQPGEGVDQIEDVHDLSLGDDSVGTVIAVDTLEHVADPLRALQEIHRVLKPGGTAVITSVMFFVIHAHPSDYWRFTPEGFNQLLAPFDSRVVISHGFEAMPESVLGIGVKGRDADLSLDRFPRTSHRTETWGQGRQVDLGPIRMTVRELWSLTLRSTKDAAIERTRRVRRDRRLGTS